MYQVLHSNVHVHVNRPTLQSPTSFKLPQHIFVILYKRIKGLHDSISGDKTLLPPIPTVYGFTGYAKNEDMFTMGSPGAGMNI